MEFTFKALRLGIFGEGVLRQLDPTSQELLLPALQEADARLAAFEDVASLADLTPVADTIICGERAGQQQLYYKAEDVQTLVAKLMVPLADAEPPIVLPVGKAHYPPLVSSRATQVALVLPVAKAAAFSSYARANLLVKVLSETPSWTMDATKEELEEPATHVRFVLWAKHADDLFWLAYHFNKAVAQLADAELAELANLHDAEHGDTWKADGKWITCGLQDTPLLVAKCYSNSTHGRTRAKLITKLFNALPGLLARLAAAEADLKARQILAETLAYYTLDIIFYTVPRGLRPSSTAVEEAAKQILVAGGSEIAAELLRVNSPKEGQSNG